MCQLCLFIFIQTLSFLGGFVCVSTNLGYNGSYVRVSLKSKIPLGGSPDSALFKDDGSQTCDWHYRNRSGSIMIAYTSR